MFLCVLVWVAGGIKIGAMCIDDIHQNVKTMQKSGLSDYVYLAPEKFEDEDDDTQTPPRCVCTRCICVCI